jgi:hypothetical protein
MRGYPTTSQMGSSVVGESWEQSAVAVSDVVLSPLPSDTQILDEAKVARQDTSLLVEVSSKSLLDSQNSGVRSVPTLSTITDFHFCAQCTNEERCLNLLIMYLPFSIVPRQDSLLVLRFNCA